MINTTINAIEATFKGRDELDLYHHALEVSYEKGLVISSTHTDMDGPIYVLWTRMVPREELE